MRSLIAFTIFVSTISVFTEAFASPGYVEGDTKCPNESDTDHYIEAPMFHDLKTVAQTQNISNFNSHDELREDHKGKIFKVYYELLSPFDPQKDMLIMIPGGPGQTHTFIHRFEEKLKGFKEFSKDYNVFVMDHRGVGCSRYSGPGEYPPESLLMRQAASDIELIRKRYGTNKKINVWGYSYGSLLAQTYALLYPQNLSKLFLGGAFSAASDFTDAMKTFEQRVLNASPEIEEDYLYLKAIYPRYAHKILKIATGYMYQYSLFRRELVDLVKKVSKAVSEYKLDEVENLLTYEDSFVMEWMMRSISCIEIFPMKLEEGAFPMFWETFSTCDEFKGKTDYFNYTEDLVNISAPTFIWGGKHDHVTTAVAMEKMATKVPNNYLYIDEHIGHGLDKPECFMKMIDKFFEIGVNNTLDDIKAAPECANPPEIENTNSSSEISRISIL